MTALDDGGCQVMLGLKMGCVRPLSLFYSDASADGVEERSLVPRSRSHARLWRSHAFFVRSAGVHRFIRRYHVKSHMEKLIYSIFLKRIQFDRKWTVISRREHKKRLADQLLQIDKKDPENKKKARRKENIKKMDNKAKLDIKIKRSCAK
ncbi:hypothetical protein EVAR_90092_1 [Eumeta japonica]|uniref:Uncharacterized protein n=1 Tax=Eumeta variegata TaxID=151549 RepID=A0A4C1WYI1_EUMVA|nr:hypothetical protein EVAR_90092_1 [Eumeta japonica]